MPILGTWEMLHCSNSLDQWTLCAGVGGLTIGGPGFLTIEPFLHRSDCPGLSTIELLMALAGGDHVSLISWMKKKSTKESDVGQL